MFHLERKHNPSSHHSTTDHVPEKKFKSEALLSTLTSDASKENTPGNLHCLAFYCFFNWKKRNPIIFVSYCLLKSEAHTLSTGIFNHLKHGKSQALLLICVVHEVHQFCCHLTAACWLFLVTA